MFKKKDKLRVGRPKLADSNLKKMSLLISAICFVMVIGLIFGGLLDLNIIGNTHKLKAEADISTLCTSIPDSLKYDENTNPYGFKDVEFFSGVLEHGHVSGDAREVYRYNDSSYCTSITKEDLEKIDRVSYSNNTITNANGIQLLTNLEELYLDCSGGLYNDKITSIDLSHNAKLVKLSLEGLTGIKNFDFSNNPNLSTIAIGRPIYYSSYVIDNLTIKNNNNLKTISDSANFYDNTISVSAGTIKNLDIENVPNLKKENSTTIKVSESLRAVNSRILFSVNNLKKIYLKDTIGAGNVSASNSELESLYIDNVPLSGLTIGNKNTLLKSVYLNNLNDLMYLTIDSVKAENSYINYNSFTNLKEVEVYNTKIDNLDLSNNPLLRDLRLYNTDISNINLNNNTNLINLIIYGNKLDTLDLSNNVNLEYVDVTGGLNNIKLPNSSNLKALELLKTNISKLDLSKLDNLEDIIVMSNALDKDIYLKKKNLVDYTDVFKINSKYNIKYESKNSKIASVSNNGIIKGEGVGSTTILVSNDIIDSIPKNEIDRYLKCLNPNDPLYEDKYCEDFEAELTKTLLEINVHVYDVTSEKYNIDDKTKVIDLKKNNIDLNEIKLGIDSLVKEISGNKLYLKDTSGNIVDEYTLVNKKEDEKESIKEEVKTTTKKKTTSNKSSTKKTTTTKKASETTTTTIKSDNDKENTNVVTNEKVVEKIAYKSNNLTLIIINIVEGILLLTLAILFIKSMKKNKN